MNFERYHGRPYQNARNAFLIRDNLKYATLKNMFYKIQNDTIEAALTIILSLYAIFKILVGTTIKIASVFKTTRYAEERFKIIDQKINSLEIKVDRIHDILINRAQ